MLIASFVGGSNARAENSASLLDPPFTRQKLSIHLITGNVAGVSLDERAKVLIRCCRVASVHAFEGQAIACESVVGILRDEFFQHLAPRFLLPSRLFSHGNVPYYTSTLEGVQTR